MNKMLLLLALLWTILYSTLLFAALRDPTRPPEGIEEKSLLSGNLALTAIVMGPTRKIAVINGVSKKLGDEIFGMHIVAIYPNTVELEGPSGKITLFLSGQPIKRLLPTECKRNWNVC